MMFQSTHPRRVWRQGSLSGSTKVCKFQSTHPRRVWPVCPEYYRTRRWFQSTHPRRVWPICGRLLLRACGFQSTHPRRVWPCHLHTIESYNMFQSTHPRRVWQGSMLSDNNYKLVSIHTPTQGVTCPDHKIKIIIECFNPHTHAGCDWCCAEYAICCFCFNPHTHAGCDIVSKDFMPVAMFQSTHPRRVWPYIQYFIYRVI